MCAGAVRQKDFALSHSCLHPLAPPSPLLSLCRHQCHPQVMGTLSTRALLELLHTGICELTEACLELAFQAELSWPCAAAVTQRGRGNAGAVAAVCSASRARQRSSIGQPAGGAAAAWPLKAEPCAVGRLPQCCRVLQAEWAVLGSQMLEM